MYRCGSYGCDAFALARGVDPGVASWRNVPLAIFASVGYPFGPSPLTTEPLAKPAPRALSPFTPVTLAPRLPPLRFIKESLPIGAEKTYIGFLPRRPPATFLRSRRLAKHQDMSPARARRTTTLTLIAMAALSLADRPPEPEDLMIGAMEEAWGTLIGWRMVVEAEADVTSVVAVDVSSADVVNVDVGRFVVVLACADFVVVDSVDVEAAVVDVVKIEVDVVGFVVVLVLALEVVLTELIVVLVLVVEDAVVEVGLETTSDVVLEAAAARSVVLDTTSVGVGAAVEVVTEEVMDSVLATGVVIVIAKTVGVIFVV